MLYVVTRLSEPLGGSLDVNASVASKKNGGLHHTSGDAPLETHHSPHPPWGHIHESNSPSLRQTKLVAVASGHKKA